MLRKIKNRLYFFVAGYFRFFARIRLRRWQPTVVVITGSNGKTTTLHLVEAQLNTRARYSHFANSAFGVPFDILGLKRKTYAKNEWFTLLLTAPFAAFRAPYQEGVYVVEADCDRPGEGLFLANLLKPRFTIWLSSARTHTYTFDKLVVQKQFGSVEEAIAFEYGHFLEKTREAVLVANEPLILPQLARTSAQQQVIEKQNTGYAISLTGTSFVVDGTTYTFPTLLPEVTYYSLVAALRVAGLLQVPIDASFSGFTLPPGRSSLFKGIKETTLIDSTYNANVASVSSVFQMVKAMQPPKLWVVAGDLTEQGNQEAQEHATYAALIKELNPEKVILVGPRMQQYVLAELTGAECFVETKDALSFLQTSLQGGETIVFKGARYLEGLVEHLLANPADAAKLCRREAHYQQIRKEWGL